VDAESQVIVAQSLSNTATNVQQLAPIVKQIKVNTGRQARELSADAGYCSEGNWHEPLDAVATGCASKPSNRFSGRSSRRVASDSS